MVTPSRSSAAQVLHRVFGEGQRVPDAWDARLSHEDAALAQALLGLCLRRWGRLMAWLTPHLKDPKRGLPLGSQVALAQGLAQLAWLPGVGAHAAVNESVELAADRELGFPPHRGLVNAILRRASGDREGLRAALDDLPASLDRTPWAERILRAAHPGREEQEALWTRLQVPPSPWFRTLDDTPLPEGMERDLRATEALHLAPGSPFPRAWLLEGHGMVQDLSSQALMDFQWDSPVTRILDTCAAPGGKTTALSRRFPEAALFALEQEPRRGQRLRENLEKRKVRAQVMVEEAGAWMAKGGRPFDLILLDAPCSGTGTLQKHPELTWLGQTVDLGRLQATQARLLDHAAARLVPGGLLLYAVCSWLPEEGADQAAAFLKRHPGMSPAEVWGGHSAFHPDPLTWPGEGFQGFAFTKG
nr:transcription antitermination factor NusB [uncultured Holophaga sp.]